MVPPYHHHTDGDSSQLPCVYGSLVLFSLQVLHDNGGGGGGGGGATITRHCGRIPFDSRQG
jgi:hypothetical protein